MGFNSVFKGLKFLKKTGNGRLNNLNNLIDPALNVLINFFYIRAVFETIWKKYGTARQVTDDNTKRRMRFAW